MSAACDVGEEQARREGAIACIRAMCQFIDAVRVPCGPQAADYYTKQYDDAKAFAALLGPMPPFVEGAFIALAEYIHMSETTGTPDCDDDAWLPWSAKTQQERAADVAWMQACFDEEDARCKVISFPGGNRVAAALQD